MYKFGDIGPVTPEITRWQIATFVTIAKNWLFPPNISENTRPIFAKFSDMVDLWVQMINLTFILRSSKGRCYGNMLIFGPKMYSTDTTGIPKRIGGSQLCF